LIGFTFAMIVFVAAYAAAASMAPLSYRPFEHGVDDLGCQQYKKSWIMKGGYLGYSALLLMNAVYAFLIGKTPLYPSLLVAGQALFAGASAFFSKRPFFRVDSFNEAEHHSHERLIQISFVLANSAMVTAWFLLTLPTGFCTSRSVSPAFFSLVSTGWHRPVRGSIRNVSMP
jgi:uncharacterized membrane-anchored protein